MVIRHRTVCICCKTCDPSRKSGSSMALLNSRVVRISIASLATGLLIGVVGAAFRLLLIKADELRNHLVLWAHAWPYIGWVAPMAVGVVGAALARWLVVRFAPHAAGSGVQR